MQTFREIDNTKKKKANHAKRHCKKPLSLKLLVQLKLNSYRKK